MIRPAGLQPRLQEAPTRLDARGGGGGGLEGGGEAEGTRERLPLGAVAMSGRRRWSAMGGSRVGLRLCLGCLPGLVDLEGGGCSKCLLFFLNLE